MADLTNVPTADLLAEVDRRTLAAQPPVVHFFGVWPGERAGHYRRDRYGRTATGSDGNENIPGRPLSLYPWADHRLPQPEGQLWHWYHRGMGLTVLTSWDRSADKRGGCCATFIVHAHVTPEHALGLARAAFPRVFDRIEAHLGRPVVLAGPVELATR